MKLMVEAEVIVAKKESKRKPNIKKIKYMQKKKL